MHPTLTECRSPWVVFTTVDDLWVSAEVGRLQRDDTVTALVMAAGPAAAPPVIVYQNTQTVTTTWSDWSTYHTKTRRYLQVDRYSQTMADTFTQWSDGSWFDTGWYQQSFTHSWQYWWALTLDPNRISARYDGRQRAGTGRTGQEWAAAGASGKCGLTGTLTSCLAEISTPPVGGGCADLRSTVQACAPLAPMPGNPNAVREAGPGTAPQRASLPYPGGA